MIELSIELDLFRRTFFFPDNACPHPSPRDIARVAPLHVWQQLLTHHGTWAICGYKQIGRHAGATFQLNFDPVLVC